MRRRAFMQLAGAGAVMPLALAEAQAEPKAARGLAGPPVLANVSPTTVELIVPIHGPATGWVEFGLNDTLDQRCDGDTMGMRPMDERLLRYRLTGLAPGTTYRYRVCVQPIDWARKYWPKRGRVVRSEPRAFRTLDPGGETTSFTVWNDTHENATTLKALSAALRENPTRYLVWNGDITNDLHTPDTAIEQFITPASQSFAETTPLMLGRGNHDVRGRYARGLADCVTGPGGRYYYAFRDGPVAAVMLDTGEDKPDDRPVYAGLTDFAAYRREQADWLKRVIEEDWFVSAPFRVAFMHIPLVWDAAVPEHWPRVWGEGIKGWVCEDGYHHWHDLLVRGGVDVVISGHTHRHAWFAPNAQRPYGQLIGGGPKPEAATIITGNADQQKMRIAVTDLSGKALIEQTWKK